MNLFSFKQAEFFHLEDGKEFVSVTKNIWRYVCDLCILKFIWNLVCGLASLIFVPSPEQQQIDEYRVKALMYRGIF